MTTAAVRTECADTSSTTLAQLDFDLPPELIAQAPAAERDSARLMVVDRGGGRIDDLVRRLPDYLQAGDVLVVNDTRVIPARLRGRLPTGGRVELLALRPSPASAGARPRWTCLAKPTKRLTPGLCIELDGGADAIVARLLGGGRFDIELQSDVPFLDYLNAHGEVPLPPYIRRPAGPLADDRSRYQTIFANPPGAIAAPTAGLHFTDELVAELRGRGIEIVPLTLHVGPGTFMPIRDGDLGAHTMEAEWYDIPEPTAAAICAAKAEGRRVIAIGTTTTRALESAAGSAEPPPGPLLGKEGGRAPVGAGSGWAGLFITPGYRFRVVDALFTNFHLPKSTLLLLVSAFAGTPTILAAYRDAVDRGYRFYSYGDAMLLR